MYFLEYICFEQLHNYQHRVPLPNLYPFNTFPAKTKGSALDKFTGLDQKHITSQSAEGGIMSTPSKVFNITTDTKQTVYSHYNQQSTLNWKYEL